MKHLGSLGVGLCSLENLLDFPGSFCQVIFYSIMDIWNIICYKTLGLALIL